MTPHPLDTESVPESGARMPDGGAPGDDDIDLQAYWRALVGRRWLILGTTGLCVLIALILTLLATPIFRADTTLQINRDTVNVVQVRGFQPVESLNDQTFYQTQYDLLKSHSLARRVVVAMDLQHDAAFQGLLRPSPLARLLGFLHGASARKPDQEDTLRADADALLHMVSVQPVLNSKLVDVSVDTPDPRLSAQIANVYADQFIRSNLDRRMAASGYAKQYLQDRLQQLKLRLEDSDKELVAFAQKHQIVNISDRQSLVGQQLEQLNVALAQAEQDRYKAEAKWRQLQGAPADQIAQVLGDPVIEKLQQAYAEDQAKYQDQLRIYKPAFPAMLQLHAKLDEIHRQIAARTALVRGSVQSAYAAAKARETLLRQRVADLRQQVLDLEQRSIRYNILKREVDTNRQLYDAILQRYKEIGVAGGVGINNISVVDRAEPPMVRYRPRLKLNLAIGLLLGLFAGIAAALVLDHLDDTVHIATDAEQKLGLAVLGIIPLARTGTPEQALLDPRSALAEAYRSARTALQFATADGVPRSLLITSTRRGEGKSTTALALAQSFAQMGRRVLLVDADMRNPAQHNLGAVDNSRGLSNVLAGALAWREAVVGGENGPALLACGPLPPNPAELLAGPRLATLLAEAQAEYDLVILDSPPVLGLADAPVLGHCVAGTLLVIEAGGARIDHIRDALKRLHAARARVVGAAITKLDARHGAYGYGYNSYDYGDAYGGKTGRRNA